MSDSISTKHVSQPTLWNLISYGQPVLIFINPPIFKARSFFSNYKFLQRRENIEKEVHGLRDQISELKVNISTITKGVPMSKIEVREERLGAAPSGPTTRLEGREKRRKNEQKSPSMMEEESSPERREKVLSLMESRTELSPERSVSPLRILQSQQQTAREILLA